MTNFNRFNAAALLLAATMIFSSCKPDEEDTTPTPTPTPTANWWDTPYVKFTVDGVVYNYVTQAGIVSYDISHVNHTSTEPTEPTVLEYQFGIDKDDMSATDYRTLFSRVHTLELGQSTLSNSSFDALFPISDLPYHNYDMTEEEGIYMIIRRPESVDPFAETYSTNFGTAEQNGSYFVISDKKVLDTADGHFVVVKVLFKYKAYNMSSGASIEVTNGEGVLKFKNGI